MSLPELRPYQAAGVEWLTRHKRVLLADEAGLGKSRQLIEASRGSTLVVAPAMVLDGGNWVDEIAKWADDSARFHCVAYSKLNDRVKTGRGSGTRPVEKLHPDLVGRDFQTVILDEAHYIKGRDSFWTWAARDVASRAEYVFAATGTPIPNWAHELFTLLQVMYPEKAVPGAEFGSYWRWVEEWFIVYPDQYSLYNIGSLRRCSRHCQKLPPTQPCAHYTEFVEENLGYRFLRRLRDDVLPDLPPLAQVTVNVNLGPNQKREYNRMRKEYLAEVDGNEIVAWSSAARHVKMDRLTTGLDLVNEESFQNRLASGSTLDRVDNGKLARLAYDLQSRSRPTLVMAHYRDSVEACAQVARDLGLRVQLVHGGTSQAQRLARVRAFQAGELDVLVGSLETLAEGLTLTSADMLIFVEQSYKPSRNEQAARRVHRLGQTRPVTVLDYVAGGTIDERKRELLASKNDHQLRTLTAADLLLAPRTSRVL